MGRIVAVSSCALALAAVGCMGINVVAPGAESESEVTGESGLASTDTGPGTSTDTLGETGGTSETSTESGAETGSESAGETGVGSDTDTDTGGPGYLDVIALVDVNATSWTFEKPVHPSSHAGSISGWYFGHAT